MTRGEKIDWDLENVPVEIKTDERMGSYALSFLDFFTAQNENAGGFWIKFWTRPVQYYLMFCSDWTDFPTTLPSATVKIWRITLDKSEGVRVIIHCNGELVLNLLLSNETCRHISNWSYFWSRDVEKIYFDPFDKASDYYRPYTGNCCILSLELS